MKTTIMAFALTFFAGTTVAASDYERYGGFAKNPDLGHDMTHMASSAPQRAMSDGNAGHSSRTTRSDIYRGFAEGNPDL